MKELVSVIMPVFNAELFLSEAINSVLAQSYPYWELLIVDDGSTDSSVRIIESFIQKDNRIRFLQTKRPSGSPSIPRNLGIDHAKGRFIAFLDSDDVWLPKKLESQIPLFDNPKVAIVYSDYEKMAEDGVRNSRIIRAPKSTDYFRLLKGNVIGNVTGIYDTAKVGKLYFLNVHHEDYVLWLTILKKGYIAMNVGNVTALYRVRKKSVSANKFVVYRWQWMIYRQIEGLGILDSMFYFLYYAVKATLKALK